MAFLSVENISYSIGETPVLENISFSQQQGQKIAIAGETGSGKSTLLQIIAGLLQPAAGWVRLTGKQILGPDYKLIAGHPDIAYLSQQHDLPIHLRVAQALEYANILDENEANDIYQVCRIDHLLQRKTHQLSGGEKQRIALARLLISQPQLLLLDEPFSNLDTQHKKMLQQVIDDIGEKLHITCMLVSHDNQDTLSWADEIICIQNGQIVQQATPREIYFSPVNTYVAGLFGAYNYFKGQEAALLAQKLNIPTSDPILMRPEAFKIKKTPAVPFSGVIQKIRFLGSSSELEVLCQNTIFLIRTLESRYKIGDTIFFDANVGC